MSASSEYDEFIVESLKRSKEIVGELLPIVIDKETGEIISGRHRKKAGWQRKIEITKEQKEKMANKLNVPVEAMPVIWEIHVNIQRTVTIEERKQQVKRLIEILLKNGVKKEEIINKLLQILPWTKQYTYKLIPDEFKTKTLVEEEKKEIKEVKEEKKEVKEEKAPALEKKKEEKKEPEKKVVKPLTEIAKEEKKEEEKPKIIEEKKPEPKEKEVKVEEKKPEEKKEEVKPIEEKKEIKPSYIIPTNKEDLEFFIQNIDQILTILEIITCPVCGKREKAGWFCHNITFEENRKILEEKLKEFTQPKTVIQLPAKSEYYKVTIRNKELIVGETILTADEYIVLLNETFEYEGKIYPIRIDRKLLHDFFIEKVIKHINAEKEKVYLELEEEENMIRKITLSKFPSLNNDEKTSITRALNYTIRKSIENILGIKS
jgi:hypothetical protein